MIRAGVFGWSGIAKRRFVDSKSPERIEVQIEIICLLDCSANLRVRNLTP
jgi:hypothetical protein